MTAYSIPILTPVALPYQLMRMTGEDSGAESCDSEAFINTIRQYEGLINRLCYNFAATASTFEDLRQDALINIWRGYPAFRCQSSPQTWIYRVVINTCVSTLRKEKRHKNRCDIDAASELFDDNTDDDSAHLHWLISQLPDFDRALILLWLEERSYEEIAGICGISVQNVASRIHRIKEKLRKIQNQSL